jgi:hypothetical protein
VQGAADGGPVLFDLGSTGKLDVVEGAWDGYLHVWQPDGSDLPGWPLKVHMPEGFKPDPGRVLIDDQKLESSPAVAYLEGRSKPPDLVVRPQYTETRGAGIQTEPFAFSFAYHSDGTPVANWPVKLPGLIEYYGSAQEFITEGSSNPVAADVSGSGKGADDVAVAPAFSPPYLVSGSGHIVSPYLALVPYPPTLLDIPVSFTTSGAFGRVGGQLSFAQAESGGASIALALGLPNSGFPISDYESLFPVAGGLASAGFPATRQGIDFLGAPIVAPVTSDGAGTVIDGGDSNALQAYQAGGGSPTGFPKWTTGWNLFSPVAGDVLSNGRVDLLSTTREGYLFGWETQGPAASNAQWWRAQHDEWNSGNYQTLTRPPGAILGLHWTKGSTSASFTAPGAFWYAGTPASYAITTQPGGAHTSAPASVPAGSTQTVPIPAGAEQIAIQAVGPSGLLGLAGSLP